MRLIDTIVIHCTATPNGRWTTAADIDLWHLKRGFRRDSVARNAFNPGLMAIGYHHVIYANGAIATGRSHAEVGAHAIGHNTTSLGLAMVGTDKFSQAQWVALRELIQALTQPRGNRPAMYPGVRIVGHRDLPDVHKLCPGFSVAGWFEGGMAPLPQHLLTEEPKS